MFGNVVRGIPGDRYEEAIAEAKRRRASSSTPSSSPRPARADRALSGDLPRADRRGVPGGPARAARAISIRAVFESWNGKRAVEYRRLNGIPDSWGTAVNVQQMVFGNKGPDSGSGVAFSRDEITGAPEPSGDFLADAQGEDVVSGVRNTLSLDDMVAGAARGARRAARGAAHPRAPLPRHAGRRVHGRGGAALPASDPQREAAGAGGGAVRGGLGLGGAARQARGAARRSTRAGSTRCFIPPSTPSATTRCWRAGWPRRPGAAKRRDRVHRGRGGRAGRRGRGGDPGPPLHRGRGRRRLRGGAGNPHLGRRQGLARRAGGAGDGAAVRLRGLRARDRPRRRGGARRRARAGDGRDDRDRRLHRARSRSTTCR